MLRITKSATKFQVHNTIVNYSHHAVHDILRNYSSYNWSFLSFDQYLTIFPTLQCLVTTIPLGFYEFNFSFFFQIPYTRSYNICLCLANFI